MSLEGRMVVNNRTEFALTMILELDWNDLKRSTSHL